VEHALEVALHVPDPADVVVGAGQYETTVVAPLDQCNVMAFAVSRRFFGTLCRRNVTQLHHGSLVLGAGSGGASLIGTVFDHKLGVEVPEVDIVIAGSSCGEITLLVVPLQEQDISTVLVEDMDARAVGGERDGGFGQSVGEGELRVEVVAVEFVGVAEAVVVGVFTVSFF